jgi:hypothetical protein
MASLILNDVDAASDLSSAARLLNLSPACVLRQLEAVVAGHAASQRRSPPAPIPAAYFPDTVRGR